jgi:hypothetical protein
MEVLVVLAAVVEKQIIRTAQAEQLHLLDKETQVEMQQGTQAAVAVVVQQPLEVIQMSQQAQVELVHLLIHHGV